MAQGRGRKGSDRIVRLATTVLVAVVVVGAAATFAAVRGCSSSAAKPAPKAASGASVAKTATTSSPAAEQTATSSAMTRPVIPSTPVADPATDQYVPVLMYHHVSPTAKNSIAITPARFDEQMRYLKQHGYHPIGSLQLAEFLATGKRLPEKPVYITFDDGRMNQITYAVPILKKYGFTAAFFINQKWVETKSSSFMHEADLKKLVVWGFDVESHTRSHGKMISRGAGYASMKRALWYESYGHRLWVEKLTGRPVYGLAWPGGFYDKLSPRLARDAGFAFAVTTNDGLVSYKGQDSELLPRYNSGARGFSMGSFAAIFKKAEAASAKVLASKAATGTAQ